MNQLLQMQSEGKRELLVYHYQKIQDVDEVILQLLNEAGLDGFIKSSVDKSTLVINYDITGYKKWADMTAENTTADHMASVLEDLYRLLAYLEDSFIDIEYVLLDTDYLFINPDTGKVQLVVIPCQSIVNEGYTLEDCVNKMFEKFSYDQNGDIGRQICEKLNSGIRSLRDLKEIVEILLSSDNEVKNTTDSKAILPELTEQFEGTRDSENSLIFDEKSEIENEIGIPAEPVEEQETDVPLFDFKEYKFMPDEENAAEKKTKLSDETAILEEIAKDAEMAKQNEADLSSDAEFMRQQLRADIRRDLEEELREKVKQDIRSESENKLREKIWAELSDTFTQNMRHDIENELREKIRKELEEEYAEKVKALEAEKNEEEAKQEADEKSSYLIRKKTGEIIQLNKQTFIIGKLDTCCDYVIRGNNAISRLHAVIKYREDSDSYFIVDCNSTNHTYLNGRRIEAEQPVELKDGMHIHLALEEFIFQLT